MRIPKWSERDLRVMGDKGYGVVRCQDEKEVEEVYTILKENKRCAQVGYFVRKTGEQVFFVCTKKKAQNL